MKNLMLDYKGSNGFNPFASLIILVLLYLTSLYNYLLFHSLAEVFSVIIAGTIFIIGWHSRHFMKNNYLLFISISYLFVGLLDLLHTLSYKGMNVFPDYDYYANQLWIAARYMESLSMLAGFMFIRKKREINAAGEMWFMSAVTAFIILSIFAWKIFPVCFADGTGLTLFKKISEYIICAILVASAWLLYKNRYVFSEKVYRYLLLSIFFTIIGELAFTFYISNYGISNLIGHYFKIFSFYCIYRAVIVTGIESPHELIFKELVDKEKKLTEANRTKDRLFSILMHDMRGPINSMHDFLHEAKDDFDSFTMEDFKNIIASGHNSISGINTMLNNLYTWIRTQSEDIQPDIRPMNLKEAVDHAVHPYERSAERKNISIDIDVPDDLAITTDKEIFKSVVRNLLNNSIKFTHDFGRVSITGRNSGQDINIYVQDNGIGINQKNLEKIFNKESRYTSKGTKDEPGSGMGLGICRDLLSIIGGSIFIESTEGEGTLVTVSFKNIYSRC